MKQFAGKNLATQVRGLGSKHGEAGVGRLPVSPARARPSRNAAEGVLGSSDIPEASKAQIEKEEASRRESLTAIGKLVSSKKMSLSAALSIVGVTKMSYYRWRRAEQAGSLAPKVPVHRPLYKNLNQDQIEALAKILRTPPPDTIAERILEIAQLTPLEARIAVQSAALLTVAAKLGKAGEA